MQRTGTCRRRSSTPVFPEDNWTVIAVMVAPGWLTAVQEKKQKLL